ncbi:MAG TPA: hypothetical protein VII45_02065 [Solirubrobacterales bacterium]
MIAKKEMKIGVRAAIAIAMLAAAFVLPTHAFATSCANAGNDPTARQYCTPPEPPPVTPPSSPPASPPASPPGSLPFTGLDLAALVAAAAVLTGTGLALRRISNTGNRKA